MKHKKLDDLQKEYLETPIPEELDFLVRKTLSDNVVKPQKKRVYQRIRAVAASIAVCIVLFTVGINSSPVFALTLSKIPALEGIIKVLTFREYTVNEHHFNADIKIPSIQGLENKELEISLNEKYLTENKKLYEEFMAAMEELKKSDREGHLGVESGYIVKTDTDKILSIARYVVNTVGSSSTVMKYDTIDKQREVLITLPSLFKDGSYVEIISEEIKKQMLAQHQADENKIYWVRGIELDFSFEPFDKISAEQNFYINSEGKLVVSFDKYEIAPGYMGILEFEIPTEILADLLVSNEYLK
ncbi:MAG: DUF3298 domain-containing protein [Peptococcaceae bacterium]